MIQTAITAGTSRVTPGPLLACMPSPIPRQVQWNLFAHTIPSASAFPRLRAGRLLHHPFRGLLDVHICYGLHARQVALATLYTRGFSSLVASTAALIATGWSEPVPGRVYPRCGPTPFTAHRKLGLGVKVNITELDVDVLPAVKKELMADVSKSIASTPELNPYADGLPGSVQQALAKRYADLFGVFLKHRDVITRVTFWCVTNGDSWLNNWPVRGRTSYPLLFDREGHPTPAYASVIGEARNR